MSSPDRKRHLPVRARRLDRMPPPCSSGKRSYHNLHRAKIAARRVKGAFDHVVRPYRCQCGSYHLTSQAKRRPG